MQGYLAVLLCLKELLARLCLALCQLAIDPGYLPPEALLLDVLQGNRPCHHSGAANELGLWCERFAPSGACVPGHLSQEFCVPPQQLQVSLPAR